MPSFDRLSYESLTARWVGGYEITVGAVATSLRVLYQTAASGGDLPAGLKYVVLSSSDLGSVHWSFGASASASTPAFLGGLGEKGFNMTRNGADELSLYAASNITVTVEVYA